MSKLNQIKLIKSLVNSGLYVKVNCQNRNIILWQENEKYIHWRCYGQSAIKNTLNDLKWLIKEILDTKNKQINYQIVEHIF